MRAICPDSVVNKLGVQNIRSIKYFQSEILWIRGFEKVHGWVTMLMLELGDSVFICVSNRALFVDLWTVKSLQFVRFCFVAG